jgi:uncharacterized protein YlxP (DUF503 family)
MNFSKKGDFMIIGSGKIYLKADWCHSLKEKRMIVKSIIEKSKKKFNISISEVESQDIHNYIVIGFAAVSSSKLVVQSTLQNLLNYIEDNCDAEVVDCYTEIL